MQKLTKLTLSVLALSVSYSAQAELAGAQSTPSNNVNYIQVGGTNYSNDDPNGHIGPEGSPGIMVNKMSPNPNDRKYVSLLGMQFIAWPDWNGVTHLDDNTPFLPASHAQNIGTHDYSRVSISGAEVYFGEWSQNGELNAPDRQVWYVGKDKTSNMPTSGSATYNVKGIRQYQHNGMMTGTLTANFATNKLSGNVGDINFGNNVNIDSNNASFAGGVSVGSTPGGTEGHFFGNNAAQLAGIATFASNKNLDTAFGGKKQ
ncbi:transferrin-binding protein-like solute binding protein [Suttonella sp. R2A3]|uniref:Slam-dependent surface lipoprotein n=1 Tax=Suttonella sp. R2A3 TaxID=2908648 RepID=UPI001F3CFAD2|nr:Slam-dependent surface lipoprotein [Suttonella sp. R2A3]UJF25374.1 transferrin-binding protein-like solute binding protein [Suttonella sp. R2A3]